MISARSFNPTGSQQAAKTSLPCTEIDAGQRRPHSKRGKAQQDNAEGLYSRAAKQEASDCTNAILVRACEASKKNRATVIQSLGRQCQPYRMYRRREIPPGRTTSRRRSHAAMSEHSQEASRATVERVEQVKGTPAEEELRDGGAFRLQNAPGTRRSAGSRVRRETASEEPCRFA